MPTPQPSAPIRFADFTPGIADLPGMGYKPETATRANTFRCIANRSGALVPLPRRQVPFALPHDGTTPTEQMAVNGLYVPPVSLLPAPATAAFTPDMFPEHELFVGTERLTAGTRYHKLLRYRRFEAPSGTGYDTLKSVSFADASTTFSPVGMTFAPTRSNRANYAQPGCPVTVILYAFGATNMYLTEFPDDQNQSSLTPWDIYTNQFFLNCCSHQGRIVVQQATVYNHGPNTITFMGENLLWSWFNDLTVAHWGTWNGGDPTVPANFDNTPKVFIPENPSGFAFMVSMSANEIFFVKTSHGGGYVSGSLDTGQVVSLPMVTGAEITHTPAVSPIGVVYGNRRSGVWVWTHGDVATLLSPQMIPDFWVITQGADLDDYGGNAYALASCDDWILTPNNFLYDTTVKSWWRLEDPAVTNWRFVTSQWHYIYTAASFFTNTADSPVSFFKREDLADTFSWQSHPVWESVEDLVHVNDIGLIAEGNGEVTLTLTALNGDTNSITIPLENCGFPERFRERLSIQGKYLQLRIESSSPNAFYPAPTVYSVTLYPYTEAPIGHMQ